MAIIISTIEDLQKIGNDLGYPMSGEYELGNDIDMVGVSFAPIGRDSAVKWFSGVFDGKGYTINNLTIISLSQGFSDYCGLFHELDGGIIKNLTLDNVSITGYRSVGAIVGQLMIASDHDFSKTYIINCHVTGEVTGVNNIGGLIGYGSSWMPVLNGIIDCSFEGTINGTDAVGGLIGYSTNLGIKDAYTKGLVFGNRHIGGLVGLYYAYDVDTAILNCYSMSDVNGTDINVGGLVGLSAWGGNVENCYSTGNVSGGGRTGGLIGYSDSRIFKCYSTGNVISTGIETGGLVGESYGDIDPSYADYCGVYQCYSTGDVVGTNYTGGLVGYNQSASKVMNSYSNSKVTGVNYVGGLIGLTGAWNNDTALVTKCYSTGLVIGNNNVDGFLVKDVGDITEVTDCYFDIDSSGISESLTATGKSTVEMKKQSTFVNWDFENIWKIIENITYPLFELPLIELPFIPSPQRYRPHRKIEYYIDPVIRELWNRNYSEYS